MMHIEDIVKLADTNFMTPQNKKPKPPYIIGWFCLIPVIGFFVGLSLVFRGIFKYKDKRLILVGVFGLVFTPLIYGFQIYESRYTTFGKQGWEILSQKGMVELVRGIEQYKIKYGQYPDSLQQLAKHDFTALINDPIQSYQYREYTIYNYQRVGNKYVLFSSGEDGIPYTADDFFPPVQITDSSKVGLIKPQKQN
jgi:hypothetical protein